MTGYRDLPQRPARRASNSAASSTQLPKISPVPPPKREQRPLPPSSRPAAIDSQRRTVPATTSPQAETGPLSTPAFSKAHKPPVAELQQQIRAPQAAQTPVSKPTLKPSPRPRSRRRLPLGKFLTSWPFWSLTSLGLISAVGVASAISLFRIPNLPNCRAIFWPTASASTRLQCAEAYANQGTVDDLLAAIRLVDALPADHPLRTDINDRIELWAAQILELADEQFHAGELEAAIATARKIPAQTAAADEIEQSIDRWREIWNRAEEIYQTAEEKLSEQSFREAFATAIKLLSVGNDYWETTKYEELTQLISVTREDGNRLGQVSNLLRRGGLSNLKKAIELIDKIQPESRLYQEAQRRLKDIAKEMLDLAEASLERQDADQALAILDEIPDGVDFDAQTADFRVLVEAYKSAWEGTIPALESAIVRLQSISRDRPLHGRAQKLISRWQSEIQGVAQLDWARQLAEPGTTSDLSAAIAHADKISRSNPVSDEAQAQVRRWRSRLETAEDQPFLERAEQLALAGDALSLRAAIAEAENIRPGRALYDQASGRIRTWRRTLQRAEDQPVLAKARQLAQSGSYQEAIATASQIGSNRALYDEAQSDISSWQGRIQGQQKLQQAYQAAETGTPAALASAIALANQVPADSTARSDANLMMNQWSWQILSLATTQANSDLSSAIEMARQVPARTEAYAAAQLKIQEWQERLEPTEEVTLDDLL
ncbi:MAG: chromosome segregation ATPase [Leptolyngbya sp. SIO4C5]|nr:chromosome segregation ATPase [Leptolyngbya sp. SIO4C5]